MNKKEYNKYYRKTKDGVISQIYSSQKSSSKARGHDLPSYSKDEFIHWIYVNKFDDLFNKWRNSDYDKLLKPSVDRLDDSKGYELNNIQLVTWKENDEKYKASSKNTTERKIKVNQFSMDNVFIKEFPSLKEAALQIKGDKGNISKVCKGIYKQHKGYIWKYSI